ncbi:hypothetical protein MNBD_ALPHA09-148 [hydrothermal vent metagenome]|uniref:Periplasmic chaperone PpiD n=1 Tax=hydrothermal vent metagenome TaxID=652676 RepID=A0A3B0SXX6_9ZZZZ
MLEALRKTTGSWITKIFLGILVLSFAVWGVADIFRDFGTGSIATVGETEIETYAFQSAYRREMATVAARLGRQLTPDEARALGIDRRVLSELLTTATLVNQASVLGLGISDDFIADQIVNSAEFKDAFGRFDRSRFEQLLANNGLSEAGFVTRSRNLAVRDQIAATVAGSPHVPKVLTGALNEFQNGERVVEYFTLPAIDPASIDTPSADDLEKFYDANKPRFTLPEFRKLNLLVLAPADLILTIEVSDEDIATEYDARRAQYETVEKRAIDQLYFSDDAKAAEASDKMAAGADFMVVAAEYGYSAKDIDLGLIERTDIVDEKIADTAFILKKGEISGAIKGLLGSAIVRVRDIEEGVLRSLEEVSGEIKTRIALERARDEVIDLHETIEDERAGGLSLAEIARKLNLRHVVIDAVDRSGKAPDGKPATDLPPNPEILRLAYESDTGVENDPIDQADGGFVWVDVEAVTPPALRPYAEVATEVEELWREDKLAAVMRDKAQSLVNSGREGVSIAGLAARVDVELQTSEPFNRSSASAPFNNGLVQAVFATPQGGFVRGHGRQGDTFIVARVKEIIVPEAATGEDAEGLETTLVAALEADLFEQYVGGLQGRFGVSVNTNVLGALTGEAAGLGGMADAPGHPSTPHTH